MLRLLSPHSNTRILEVSGSAHYTDVIMTTIASQITSLTVVYSTVYPEADQRKHQSSAPLAFVRGIHRDRWIPRTKGQLRGKCFHLMTSSCLSLCVPLRRALWGDESRREYRQVSNIRRTKSQHSKDSHTVLRLSLPNPLKPDVKSRMKMLLEQRRQAMLQLHLSDRQLYCWLRCDLY